MLKIFRFQCMYCQEIFEELVEGVEGMPEECLRCGEDLDFKKLPTAPNIPPPIDWNK